MFLVIFYHCYRYSTNIIVMTSHSTTKIDTSYPLSNLIIGR
nr:MAG TPA: hypothetical protein [Caudoviricetes sp.]